MATGRRAKSEDFPVLDQWVAYRFGLIATRMGAMCAPAYQGRHKLSTSAWRALAVVARFEPLSAATLSQHTRLDPSKVSRAIETLVGRKLLTRDRDPADQRRAVLRLTAKGREIHDEIALTVIQVERTMTSTLTAAERKVLWAVLDKIDARVNRHLGVE